MGWVSEIYSGHGGVALGIQVVAPTAGEGQSERVSKRDQFALHVTTASELSGFLFSA